MYRWDNYTRELVRGWSQWMTCGEISDCWPWPQNRPSPSDVLGLQLELSVADIDQEKRREWLDKRNRECG
jgi:hypothetical protein